jgi:type 2 lantibiotic biosynthesis protein LanM
VDFSIELEHLSYAFLANRTRPESWPILRAEQRSMERLDIPFFSGRGADDTLYADGRPLVPRYFQRSSEADVLHRLSQLDASDLACQLALIDGCFLAIRAQSVPSRGTHREAFADLPVPDSRELIERAIRLADEIAARAIPEIDGGLGWIGLRHVFEAERVQLQVLSNGLYDGRGGIAVFFAALFRATGERRFRDLALRALVLLRREIAGQDAASAQRFARFNGIGGAAGLGSMIYSLVKVHALVDEPALLADATRLAELISPQLVEADKRLDVMGGAAGAILGLLSLHEAAPSESVLRTAALCGDHLLAHRHGEPSRPRAWQTLSERPLTGFSHGAAGISYALLRLHAATRAMDYRLAAMEGMQYERDVFSPADANWPDFRESEASSLSCLTRWCHGAPGIGLGRLASLPIAHTGQMDEDIRIALRTTSEFPMDAVDHLCCGNFGRIDVLLTGAQKLGNEDHRRAALVHAANVLARADRTGAFRLFPHLSESVFDPGFFRGTAGIGYSLLRLACDDLPSVLTWA